jgi:hypothetical protein
LWKYEDNMWTLVSGSLGIEASSVFSTPRISDPNAYPGARRFPACWKDNNGHFWLYGGYTSSNLGDTWRFDGIHWAYWGGPTQTGSEPEYGPLKTFSFEYHPGGRYHMSITSSGSVAYIVGGYGNKYYADVWKFESDKGWAFWGGSTTANQNPTSGTLKVPSETNILGSRYGAMSVVDDFDNIWIFGGYTYSGLKTMNQFILCL